MKRIASIASALLMLGAAPLLAENRPDDFTLRFTLHTAPDASLQRLTLPVEALAALQTVHAADVRIYNGNGQAVPMAQIPARKQTRTEPPRAWPIYPVMASKSQQQNRGNLSLRIEHTADRRIVRVTEGTDPHLAATATQHVATLVDTRPLKGPLAELTVDAELAPGEPVALTVTASQDLKHWRTLAQDVPVFRLGATGVAPDSMRVPLSGIRLENEYLHISWPPGSTFDLRGVMLTPAARAVAPPRLSVPLVAEPDGTGFVFAISFATPLQALDIRPADSNTLVPVRISGRSQRGEPWRTLASGVVYRIHSGNAESLGPPLELSSVSVRELRIEPTGDTAGFATPPHVSALLSPQEWVFVASGPPPFILAAGRAGTTSARMPLASLIPGYSPGAEQKLPTARVDAASLTHRPPGSLARISQALGAPSPRSLVLWAVLIGGVLVLGSVAWAVMRQMKSADKPQA